MPICCRAASIAALVWATVVSKDLLLRGYGTTHRLVALLDGRVSRLLAAAARSFIVSIKAWLCSTERSMACFCASEKRSNIVFATSTIGRRLAAGSFWTDFL